MLPGSASVCFLYEAWFDFGFVSGLVWFRWGWPVFGSAGRVSLRLVSRLVWLCIQQKHGSSVRFGSTLKD